MENEAGTGWPSDSDKDYPPPSGFTRRGRLFVTVEFTGWVWKQNLQYEN